MKASTSEPYKKIEKPIAVYHKRLHPLTPEQAEIRRKSRERFLKEVGPNGPSFYAMHPMERVGTDLQPFVQASFTVSHPTNTDDIF